MADKYLTEEEFRNWNEKCKEAKSAIIDREEKVHDVCELIETELELIGSTAIEDKLQDEVADTINFMKNAGIKVWVLTGDKVETAVNIGISAGLITRDI